MSLHDVDEINEQYCVCSMVSFLWKLFVPIYIVMRSQSSAQSSFLLFVYLARIQSNEESTARIEKVTRLARSVTWQWKNMVPLIPAAV